MPWARLSYPTMLMYQRPAKHPSEMFYTFMSPAGCHSHSHSHSHSIPIPFPFLFPFPFPFPSPSIPSHLFHLFHLFHLAPTTPSSTPSPPTSSTSAHLFHLFHLFPPFSPTPSTKSMTGLSPLAFTRPASNSFGYSPRPNRRPLAYSCHKHARGWRCPSGYRSSFFREHPQPCRNLLREGLARQGVQHQCPHGHGSVHLQQLDSCRHSIELLEVIQFLARVGVGSAPPS